ncbi:MAG TPA: hypothetical protein VH853_03690 [Polyangia bacterium]|jgi:hypothetical protein|nr:hypothetical protein [Polyangia bacterium]
MPDARLKGYAPQAVRHLAAAGSVMVARQATAGAHPGSVPPWPGAADPDFHATLAAVWIWARHQRLSGVEKFAAARKEAWGFLVEAAPRFVPDAIDSATDDEAAYDCAMVLWAVAAEYGLGKVEARRQAIADRAARVLSMHLGELDDLSGREFRDPGFLALALMEYARAVDARGLLASGRKFVERAFGMKAPAPFADEPAPPGGLFDFSSTTATRILAVISAEGNTPFVGAWLRERIAAGAPHGFAPRRLDENSWNACAAWALGRAYVIATDPAFLECYTAIVDEIERRDVDHDCALGRDKTVRVAEVTPTFYYALAIDALVTSDSASQARAEAGGTRGR